MQSTPSPKSIDHPGQHIPDRLPADNPSQCYWQTPAAHELDNYRSTPELPQHSDIIIIGAGLAGISTAYHLIKEDGIIQSQKTITILEARGLCSGSTGRNGGHLRPDLYGQIPTYIRREGKAAAEEVARFEIAHVQALKQFVQEEGGVDCDFTLTRSFDVWCNEDAAKKAKQVYDWMVGEGLDYMDDVFFYEGEDAERICGVKGAVAYASFTAGTLSTYKFVMHLVKKLVATGTNVNLQTYTPATSIKQAAKGGYEVQTPRGHVFASQIIHANNAYVSALLPEYAKNIIPCKGICCQIRVPQEVTPPLLTNGYITRAVQDNTLSYLIQRPDGSVLVGGASSQFRPFKEQWYDNTDDAVLIEAARYYYVDFMQRTFRGWEDTGAEIEQIWTGVMGYSYDSLPHVGQVPAREDQFIIAGFNGHGTPVIWLTAKELAKMVAREIRFEETEMPKLFKTTQFRIDRALEGGEEKGDIIGDGSAMRNIGTF